MKSDRLSEWIDALTDDIEFDYLGVHGAICPFSRTDIALSYGEDAVTVDSVREAMEAPFFDGKALQEICEQIDFREE